MSPRKRVVQTSVIPHGVLTLTGYGLRVAVERGHLVCTDGIADRRRTLRFSRVDRTLKRLVIIGHSGTVSLDAIDWLQGVGVPLIHLTYDGRLYFVSSPGGRPVAQLRRAQALALDAPPGLAIARDLVLGKIQGQELLLAELLDGDAQREQMLQLLHAAADATTLTELRDVEARAARTYWRAWRRMPIRWDAVDAKRRPRHWRTFGSRVSPLAQTSPRKAVNPANAVLNYLYAILEAEATIAALGARLDPALGVLHTDRWERASLSVDLMEPVRPVVDRFAASLFRERVFRKEHVVELADGQCRLMPSVTQELAQTASLWARLMRPVAEQVAKALVTKPRRRPTAIVPGVSLPRRDRHRTPRSATSHVRVFGSEPVTTWAELMRPAGEWVGTQTQRRVFAANRKWEEQYGAGDDAIYRREIQPFLNEVPLRALVRVTRLSKTTCNQIRRGAKVPHARHWAALERLVVTEE